MKILSFLISLAAHRCINATAMALVYFKPRRLIDKFNRLANFADSCHHLADDNAVRINDPET